MGHKGKNAFSESRFGCAGQITAASRGFSTDKNKRMLFALSIAAALALSALAVIALAEAQADVGHLFEQMYSADCLSKSSGPALLEEQSAISEPGTLAELAFTRSLLALSTAHSPARDDSPEPVLVESSWLPSARRAQLKIHDPAP